ncbi:Protein TANC1 [Symbiodinium microadriaticum]|uniref:Protein TANC1 n=1 Tax=Symbiodinium microadriaticum TaxID=2951 RepID=A0A1Q9F4V5_SYMMI|nr:Protein TANC1 [Symbiodinium microadriaticum]
MLDSGLLVGVQPEHATGAAGAFRSSKKFTGHFATCRTMLIHLSGVLQRNADWDYGWKIAAQLLQGSEEEDLLDLVQCNAVIAAIAASDLPHPWVAALRLLDLERGLGLQVDAVALNSVISCCGETEGIVAWQRALVLCDLSSPLRVQLDIIGWHKRPSHEIPSPKAPDKILPDDALWEDVGRPEAIHIIFGQLVNSFSKALSPNPAEFVARSGSLGDKDMQGKMPLTVAAQCNHLEVLRLLLGARANSNLKDHEALAVDWMQGAFAWMFVRAMQLLLDGGADKDLANDRYGCYLVVLCCGHAAAVRLLVAASASFDLTDEEGNNIGNKLISAMVRSVDIAKSAVRNFLAISYAVAKALVEFGAAKDQTTRMGITPLFVAAYFGRFHVAQFLVQAEDEGVLPRYLYNSPAWQKGGDRRELRWLNAALHVCSGAAPLPVVSALLRRIRRSRMHPDAVTWTALIAGSGRTCPRRGFHPYHD